MPVVHHRATQVAQHKENYRDQYVLNEWCHRDMMPQIRIRTRIENRWPLLTLKDRFTEKHKVKTVAGRTIFGTGNRFSH
jgi:hypothetical protein